MVITGTDNLLKWIKEFEVEEEKLLKKLEERLNFTQKNSDDSSLFFELKILLRTAKMELLRADMSQTLFLYKHGIGKGYLQDESDFLYQN